MQVELDFAVEVRMQAPHGAQVQQQLAVGPEELAGVEQAFELFESVVEHKAAFLQQRGDKITLEQIRS